MFLVHHTLCRALKSPAITNGYLALRLTSSIKHLDASLSAPGLTLTATISALLRILTQKAVRSSRTYRRTIFAPIFWGRSIATPPAGLPGRGRSSVRSVFHGQFNVWPGRSQVSVIIPQFAFVPLTMALISSSLLAAPFTFHNAVFIGVWSFPMSHRGTSPAVWRPAPDATLLLLGSDILPRIVSSGEAPRPRTFLVETHP